MPNNKCFNICYPLHLYLNLNNKRFENSIKAGRFEDKGGKIPHYWLRLDNEKDTIIDPTIRQFEETREQFDEQDPVYFGPTTKKYNELPYHFEDTYEDWKYCLLHDGSPRPLLFQQAQQKKMDIKILLKINLAAATILYTEREKKGGIHSDELNYVMKNT